MSYMKRFRNWFRLAGRRLPRFPNSDQRLACTVNLDTQAYNYEANWRRTTLITDHKIEASSDAADYFQSSVETIQRADIRFGTYISGGQVLATARYYPAEAITIEQTAWSQSSIIHGVCVNRDGSVVHGSYVNLDEPVARLPFGRLLVEEISSRPGDYVFLDNIAHNSAAGPHWFAWLNSCDLMRRVREGCPRCRKLLIVNIAVDPGALNIVELEQLAMSVDGVAFEMPFVRARRERFGNQYDLIENYRYLLDAGKLIVLIPVDAALETEAQRDAERRFIAAFAMMIRKPGDRLFVAWPFWKPAPDWATWPQDFGAAFSPATVNPEQQFIERRFRNGRLQLDLTGVVLWVKVSE